MKRVKCYGKSKFTTVDSSFTRRFFGSFDSRNSVGRNNFQEFKQKQSSSFSSVASTSDYTNNHSLQLFVPVADSCDGSLSTNSALSCSNLRRKFKSVKHSVARKTYHLKKFSNTSASYSFGLQSVLTGKPKKPHKKHTGTSKSCVKQRNSKPIKSPAKVSASYSSHTDLRLSYTKGRSKNVKRLNPYKKFSLKRNHSRSRHNSLKKHYPITIQPSCSEFLKNPSSVINAGMKKPNKNGVGKKKQLISKAHEVDASNYFNIDMIPSFNSEHNSFWVALQPRWSSIYEHSFKIEKVSKERKKVIPVFIEQRASKDATFPDFIDEHNKLLSNKGSISGGIPVKKKSEGSSSCNHFLAVEKCKSTDEPNVASIFSKQASNLNINSLETVDDKHKTAKDISEIVIVCKLSTAIVCFDSVNGQTISEVENTEIQALSDKKTSIVSNLRETVSEKLNVNNASINTDENASKDKSIAVCKKISESMKSNEDISAASASFSASRAISEGNNSFKRNKETERLSINTYQLQDYSSVKPFKKDDCFYSSTPLASPSTHASVVQNVPPSRTFSPVLQKGLFTTSTPAHSSKAVRAYETCNVSKISCLGRQCNSLQDLSTDSLAKLRRCPSTKINSSMLSIRNKIYASLKSSSSHSNQNTHNRTSRSCISFSKREQSALGGSNCCNKSRPLMKEASSVASTSAESIFESTLSRLLEFCGQSRLIPFNELYNWSHTTVRKIGEGTYGEVFTLVQNKISSVIKIIPYSEESEDYMQSIESVLSEITVSKCLSELRNNKNYKTRNFNKLKSVHLVQGCYPDQMLLAWDKFSDDKTTCNFRPDFFNDQQMFAIIELEYGGKDMSCFILRNAAEAESVLKQIAISLAIAEETHLFEHRDLHLGNILVQRNASKTISYVLGGKAYSIPNHGLIVTIIDFTLSRVFHEGCIFYNNIADDESLFNQSGDYQFQIYKDTKQLLNNEWHKCLLYSNVLWLSFLCVKLLESNYSRPSSKKHEEGLNNIKTFKNNLQTCQNAFECLTTCNILMSVPKNKRGPAKKMAKNAKLVDRKSFQKSISHHTSNVA